MLASTLLTVGTFLMTLVFPYSLFNHQVVEQGTGYASIGTNLNAYR